MRRYVLQGRLVVSLERTSVFVQKERKEQIVK